MAPISNPELWSSVQYGAKPKISWGRRGAAPARDGGAGAGGAVALGRSGGLLEPGSTPTVFAIAESSRPARDAGATFQPAIGYRGPLPAPGSTETTSAAASRSARPPAGARRESRGETTRDHFRPEGPRPSHDRPFRTARRHEALRARTLHPRPTAEVGVAGRR